MTTIYLQKINNFIKQHFHFIKSICNKQIMKFIWTPWIVIDICEAYIWCVQRAIGPLAEVFRGRSPLNGGSWTRTNADRSREIYSLLPLPLGDTPEEMLTVGIEPTTVRLQVGCSTN